ncbi:hypothetical protein BH10PSE14_BH10PSE14_31800 [soil metagenome]
MLALQVAAGIVLAYVVIVNQRKLLTWGKGLLSTAIFLAITGFILLCVIGLYQTAHDRLTSPEPLPAWASKLITMLGIIPIFILGFTGAAGLLCLIGLAFQKTPAETMKVVTAAANDGDATKKVDDKGCMGIAFGAGLLMLAVNYALSWPVFAYTPLGAWSDQLYRYGMTNEWKDGLQLLFFGVLWQWPWIPVGIYYLMKRLKARGVAIARGSDDARGEF